METGKWIKTDRETSMMIAPGGLFMRSMIGNNLAVCFAPMSKQHAEDFLDKLTAGDREMEKVIAKMRQQASNARRGVVNPGSITAVLDTVPKEFQSAFESLLTRRQVTDGDVAAFYESVAKELERGMA